MFHIISLLTWKFHYKRINEFTNHFWNWNHSPEWSADYNFYGKSCGVINTRLTLAFLLSPENPFPILLRFLPKTNLKIQSTYIPKDIMFYLSEQSRNKYSEIIQRWNPQKTVWCQTKFTRLESNRWTKSVDSLFREHSIQYLKRQYVVDVLLRIVPWQVIHLYLDL